MPLANLCGHGDVMVYKKSEYEKYFNIIREYKIFLMGEPNIEEKDVYLQLNAVNIIVGKTLTK